MFFPSCHLLPTCRRSWQETCVHQMHLGWNLGSTLAITEPCLSRASSKWFWNTWHRTPFLWWPGSPPCLLAQSQGRTQDKVFYASAKNQQLSVWRGKVPDTGELLSTWYLLTFYSRLYFTTWEGHYEVNRHSKARSFTVKVWHQLILSGI